MAKTFEKFVKEAPVAVMARALLERALEPEGLDALFRNHAKRQYEKELLFSSTVDVMALVVCGQHPSVRAAYQSMREELPVSLTALYGKVNAMFLAQQARRAEPRSPPPVQSSSSGARSHS